MLPPPTHVCLSKHKHWTALQSLLVAAHHCVCSKIITKNTTQSLLCGELPVFCVENDCNNQTEAPNYTPALTKATESFIYIVYITVNHNIYWLFYWLACRTPPSDIAGGMVSIVIVYWSLGNTRLAARAIKRCNLLPKQSTGWGPFGQCGRWPSWLSKVLERLNKSIAILKCPKVCTMLTIIALLTVSRNYFNKKTSPGSDLILARLSWEIGTDRSTFHFPQQNVHKTGYRIPCMFLFRQRGQCQSAIIEMLRELLFCFVYFPFDWPRGRIVCRPFGGKSRKTHYQWKTKHRTKQLGAIRSFEWF